MAATAATFSFSADLLLSALLAVVQVVLTMAPGAYYGRNGTVDITTRRSLSKISWELLLPAMAWYNILTEISASNISSVWPFAANAVIGNVVGILLGWVGARVSRTPRHLRSHMAAAAGFGNLNSLPLLIIQAVCNQEDMPFWGELGASCSSTGFGYVALGSAAMQIVMFPVAAWMLSTPQEPFVTPAASVLPEWVSRQLSSRLSLRSLRGPSGRLSASAGGQPAGAAGPGGGDGGALTDSPKHSAPGSEAEAAAPGAPAQQQQQQQQRQDDRQPSGELHIVVALPSSQLPSCTMGSTGNTASQKLQQDTVPDDAPSLACGQPAGAAAPPAQVSQAPQSAARRRLWLAWSFFRQYYLQAACIVPAAALVVTCITPLRNLLVPDQTAALGFLMGALYSIEISLLFVTSFILGAVLCRGPGAGGKDLGWRPCAMITLLRMGVMPVVGAVIVIGSNKLGIWSPLNPVFTFVLLLQWAVPTANQMQNLASIHNNNEQAMGTLIFWQYAAACLALPAWMTFYLYLMDAFKMMS